MTEEVFHVIGNAEHAPFEAKLLIVDLDVVHVGVLVRVEDDSCRVPVELRFYAVREYCSNLGTSARDVLEGIARLVLWAG